MATFSCLLGRSRQSPSPWPSPVSSPIILLKLLDAAIGLRVTQDQKVAGLALSQLGEEGYIHV